MPSMTADLELFQLGPGAAFHDGTYVGEVSETTPLEIAYNLTGVDMKSARLGRVNMAITDYDCRITVPVVEIDPRRISLAIPGSVLVGDLLTVYFTPGFKIRGDTPKQLVVYRLTGSPLVTSSNPRDIFTIYDATPMPGQFRVTMNAKQQMEVPIVFMGWSDPNTGRVWSTGA